MRLSWRLPFILITLVIIFVIFETQKKEHSKQIEKKRRMTSEKRFNYKKHKKILTNRLKSLIAGQSLGGIVKKSPERKKVVKDIDNGNYKLHRLLFQMWDPNKQHDQANLLSCDNLISMDEKEYRQGRRFARKLNHKFYEYINVSEIYEAIRYSCMPVHNIFAYKTPKYSAASYPIAYTITLDRTAEQSLRFLSSIYHHDNIYCIHPNSIFGSTYLNVFKKISECVPNIILPDRIYGIKVKTYNRLLAQLACFKKLLNTSIPWRYGFNLPSSAFPLRNNTYLIQYLKQKPYENVVPWDIPAERFEKRFKYSFVLKEIEGETLLLRTNFKKKSPPGNIKIFRKGEHFISTREFWEFLTESDIAKSFLEWAHDTKNPEDFFYASMNRYKGAPGGTPYDEEDLQQEGALQTTESENIIDLPNSDFVINLWKSDHSIKCHGVYRGFMCIFGSADLRWLIQQDSLFAFSFDYRVDRVAIDCLTKHIQTPLLTEYNEETRNLFS